MGPASLSPPLLPLLNSSFRIPIFLTAPDILDDSAVSFVCTVFDLSCHSWFQSVQPAVDMIRAILSLPAITGSLADLFTIIAPMVPADSTALPEICDVG